MKENPPHPVAKFLLVLACAVSPLVVWPIHSDLYSAAKVILITYTALAMLPFCPTIFAVPASVAMVAAIVLEGPGVPSLYETWSTYIAYTIIGVCACRHGGRWILPWIAASAAVISIVTICQVAGRLPVLHVVHLVTGARILYSNISSTLHNENYIGQYCAMVIPLFLALSFHRRIHLLVVVLVGTCLVLSESWLGMLGTAAACLPLFFIRKIHVRKRIALALVAALMASGAFAWMEHRTNGRTVEMILAKLDVKGDSYNRLFGGRGYVWSGTLKSIEWLPAGPPSLVRQFEHDRAMEKTLKFPEHVNIDRPHCVYLQVAHAFGWPGILLYLGALVLLFRHRQHSLFSTGCLLGVLGFHVAGIFNDGGPATWPLLAALAGSAITGNTSWARVPPEGRAACDCACS